MTQDEIIELGKQAGIKGFEYYEFASKEEKEAITTFVNLVAAKATAVEREACAKLVEAESHMFATLDAVKSLAKGIRARGEA